MYKLKLIINENDILLFENKRQEVFNNNTKSLIENCAYGKEIKEGNMLAFGLFNEKEIIGGILTIPVENEIFIERLFIDKNYRGKGLGNKLLSFVEKNKPFFENYYGMKIDGITAEPILSSINLFYNNDFISSGYKVYKKI